MGECWVGAVGPRVGAVRTHFDGDVGLAAGVGGVRHRHDGHAEIDPERVHHEEGDVQDNSQPPAS